MNLYETLCFEFNNALGGNYLLSYNNNENTDWENILKNVQDDLIHAVLTISGGEVGNLNGYVVETKQAMLNFAIPTEKLNEAIPNIEAVFTNYHTNLNDKVIVFEEDGTEYYVQISYNYRTDASGLNTFNGVTYSLVSVYLTFLITDSLVFSNEVVITIDGTELKGVFSFTPSTKHTFESTVYLGAGGAVNNYCTSINTAYTIGFVFIKGNSLHAKLLSERTSDYSYSVSVTYTGIEYNNNDITDSFTMRVQDMTLTINAGDTVKANLVLLEV